MSAEKVRQWLAGMVSEDKPPDKSDRDAMKTGLIHFLSRLPLVFALERLTMWEKIGNAAFAALENCNNDMMSWVNLVIEGTGAHAGRVAACEELRHAIDALDRDEWWQVECLRVFRELRFVLPARAREVWELLKIEKGWTSDAANTNGEEVAANGDK